MGRVAADERDVVEGAPTVVAALVPGGGPTAVDGALQFGCRVAVLEPSGDGGSALGVQLGLGLGHDLLPVGEDRLHDIGADGHRAVRSGVGGARRRGWSNAAIGSRKRPVTRHVR